MGVEETRERFKSPGAIISVALSTHGLQMLRGQAKTMHTQARTQAQGTQAHRHTGSTGGTVEPLA